MLAGVVYLDGLIWLHKPTLVERDLTKVKLKLCSLNEDVNINFEVFTVKACAKPV